MYDRVFFHPVKGKCLTKKQKRGGMRVVMFPKKKICGKIKGRKKTKKQIEEIGCHPPGCRHPIRPDNSHN